MKINELAIELEETEENFYQLSTSIRFIKLILIYFNIAVTTNHIYETFCINTKCLYNVIFLIACKNFYISYKIIYLTKIIIIKLKNLMKILL